MTDPGTGKTSGAGDDQVDQADAGDDQIDPDKKKNLDELLTRAARQGYARGIREAAEAREKDREEAAARGEQRRQRRKRGKSRFDDEDDEGGPSIVTVIVIGVLLVIFVVVIPAIILWKTSQTRKVVAELVDEVKR